MPPPGAYKPDKDTTPVGRGDSSATSMYVKNSVRDISRRDRRSGSEVLESSCIEASKVD